jgi:hypothetical protein
MVAKLGPLLSTSAAIFAGLVKIMLDAEAQAKQFNKDILESAGSADFLAQAGGDANKAYKNLDKTLENIRDHAFDAVENLKWGITAKEHQAVLNTLNQEGIQVTSLTKDFKNAGEAAEQSAAAVQDWTDLTHMSVAYSRNFGVSLQEIGLLQAELFTELGTSLSGIQLQFARMHSDAAESGIAMNKFFNIVRGVSADLALYNTRLAETTTILKKLGQGMSPKNAQKFLHTLTRGFKDMSEEDRLKKTLVVGEGNMRKIVERDLSRKKSLMYSDLAKELSKAGGELGVVTADQLASSSSSQFEKYIATLPKERQAALREARSEFAMDDNALKKGGAMGVAEASSNLSAAAAFTADKKALQRFAGNKKLSEMTGVEAFAARKVTGISLEDFRARAKMEKMLDDERASMMEALKTPEGSRDAKQKEMVDHLQAIGITTQEQLAKAEDDDIIAAMTKSDQEALAASQEQINWAEKQAGLTSTISDKMETIIDGIFEFLFVALKDIISDLNEFINLVSSQFGKARPEKEARNQLRSMKTDKNARVVETMQRALAAEGPGDAKAKMISSIAPMLSAGMGNASKAQIEGDVSSVIGYGFRQDNKKVGQVVNYGDTKIDQFKKDAFNKIMEANPQEASFVAMKKAGFDQNDMKAFLEKSLWGLDAKELARVAPELQTIQMGAGSIKNRPQATSGSPAATSGSPAATPGSPAAASTSITTTTGGTTAAVGATPKPPPQAEGDAKQGEELIKGNEAIHDALRQDGIKIDKSFLKTTYEKSVQDAVLDAARQALFEYALYTAKDPKSVLDRMGKSGFGRVGDMAGAFLGDPKNAEFLGTAAPHATGGVVSAINNGMAIISPAPGEGMASIGKGETIVPRGGSGRGGDTFQINVSGIGGNDLARYLRERVSEIVYEYKRREKFG